jgi:hypothetical protein
MPVARVCTECPASLEGKPPTAKTCSSPCRKKRARRIARARKQGGAKGGSYPEHLSELSAVARDVAPDLMRDVIREEARPIAREALTEDVLRATQDLLKLTPKAVENIAADMASGDERIRQKATEFVLRYTLGNQSIAPTATNNPAPMQVVLNWPTAPPAVIEGSAVELEQPALAEPVVDAPEHIELPEGALRDCMWCHKTKPVAEFVGVSDRCQACHDDVLADVRERFGEDAV